MNQISKSPRRVLLSIIALMCLLCTVDAMAARRRPAKKKKPESKLPSLTSGTVVEVVGVDPDKLRSAIRSARKIDSLIAKSLEKHKLEPNPKATDEQFVRRAYLTITGTIPTALEAEVFTRSINSDKREKLVDRLLATPGHASHMYNGWADTLRLIDRGRGNNQLGPYREWVKECMRNNEPYDEFVYKMLTSEGHTWDNPAAGYLLRDSGMPLDNLNNTIRIFLGTRIGCAQCHNHPFDRWTQKEFYQLAAFVSGSNYRYTKNRDYNLMMSTREPKKLPPGGWFYSEVDYDSHEGGIARRLSQMYRYNFAINDKIKLRFPKDYAYSNAKPGSIAEPAVIFGTMPDMKGKSRREAFAEWLIADDNPRFARTIANRLWKQVFGRGLIEPVDDMKDDTVASNPELMAFLEDEMKRLDYNIREYMRILYLTDLFGRQVTYDDIPGDEPYYFPGPVLRRMTAEQVWDSLLTLTIKHPYRYKFDFTPEFTAVMKLDDVKEISEILERVENYDAYRKKVREVKKKLKYKGQELLPASELEQPVRDGHFLREFGMSDREQIDDSNTEGSVPQLLAMFNGFVTHMMLEQGSVIYDRVVSRKTADSQIDAMFWSLLSRKPTEEERWLAMEEMRTHGAAGYGNVIWALLNTREFLFVQ